MKEKDGDKVTQNENFKSW